MLSTAGFHPSIGTLKNEKGHNSREALGPNTEHLLGDAGFKRVLMVELELAQKALSSSELDI